MQWRAGHGLIGAKALRQAFAEAVRTPVEKAAT
jgi:hypothetical protein